MDDVKVRVHGLKELRKELRKLADAKTFATGLKDAHHAVAQLVVDAAAGIARTKGRAAERAASTLVARRQQVAAKVTIGSDAVPFALGWEFGANPDRQRTGPSGRRFIGYRQFPAPARRSRTTGFLYPAIAANRDRIERQYLDAINDITSDAFPD